jgi:hypothetical protein
MSYKYCVGGGDGSGGCVGGVFISGLFSFLCLLCIAFADHKYSYILYIIYI